DPGYSQATLMMVVSEREDLDQFRRDWLPLFGSVSATPCHWDFSGYTCMSVEGVNDSPVKGNLYFGRQGAYSVLVAYMGLPETFKHNLPHARDFMRAISWYQPP